MSRRLLVLSVAGFLTVLLAGVAVLLPVPYVALLPGPTTNTLGSVRGTELIRISGHPVYPDTGHLDLVTVSVVGGPQQGMDLVTAVRDWVDPTRAVVPEETIYPKGQSARQAEQQSTAEMTGSQENATVAALRQLKIPVTTETIVASLAPTSPSAGKLKKGDVFVSVDGVPVTGGASLRAAVTAVSPGTPLAIVLRRKGVTVTTSVTTGKAPDDGRAVSGVETADQSHFPFTVDISLRDVGGPSAGLMFALGIVDKLTPGSLTGGRFIAGTGTIDDAGVVGPIGGIAQKMVGARDNGATVFLSPAKNCADAKASVPEGLRLVKVATLAQAVTVLQDLDAGRASALPSC